MKIYTKKGDKGITSIGKKELPKYDIMLEVIGTIDELNAFLGLARYRTEKKKTKDILEKIQKRLFDVAAVIIKLKEENFEEDVAEMEKTIDEFMEKVEIKGFVLPGGKASYLHVARTICRRAERRIVLLNNVENLEPSILKFFNRLSDLLFALAIYEEK